MGPANSSVNIAQSLQNNTTKIMADMEYMRVNGSLMNSMSGKKVIVMGQVQQIDSSGMQLEMRSCDGRNVRVRFPEPLQQNVEGLVEIHGESQGGHVLCENYIAFPMEYGEKFDMDAYNQAIQLINTVKGNPWQLN